MKPYRPGSRECAVFQVKRILESLHFNAAIPCVLECFDETF